MLISKLDNKLSRFCDKTNSYRAMLIDGKWGCGKTYTVNKFVENNINSKTIYVSLFGIKEVNEIVVRLSVYLNSRYINNFDGTLSLKSPLNELPLNGLLVVFDDLERIDENLLSFASIYGVINSLRNLGFRIVCICNSLEIDKKDQFEDFKEKTFDDVVNVEADARQMSDITGVNIAFENTLLKTVNDNWRIIKRSVQVYNDIIKEAEKAGVDNVFKRLDIDESGLFRCAVLASYCYFGSRKNIGEIADQYEKFSCEYEVEQFGKIVGTNFYSLFKKDNENDAFKGTVRLILLSLVNSNDYFDIIDAIKPKKNNSLVDYYPFNKELFYLDDNGHNEYKRAFFAKLDEFDFSDRQQQRIAVSVILNCLDELTDEEIDSLINHIVKTIPSEESRVFMETFSLSNEYKNEKMKAVMNKLQLSFMEKSNNENQKNINEIINKRDYSELTNYLYENKYLSEEKKNAILEFLKDNDFCLPDLSKEVSYSSWGYCHEVARFVAGTEYEQLFINALMNQCRRSDSVQLRKKCNALVKYNLNTTIEFMDVVSNK